MVFQVAKDSSSVHRYAQAEIDEHCKGVLEYLDYIRDEKGKQ